MKIERETHGEAVILTLNGRLDSRTSGLFEAAMNAAFEGGATSIVVDFSSIEFLSSAGLRVLLVGAKQANALSGKLMCAGMSDPVYDVFEKCGMATIIQHVPQRADAIGQLA
jgi:anti-anti-sigma factor